MQVHSRVALNDSNNTNLLDGVALHALSLEDLSAVRGVAGRDFQILLDFRSHFLQTEDD